MGKTGNSLRERTENLVKSSLETVTADEKAAARKSRNEQRQKETPEQRMKRLVENDMKARDIRVTGADGPRRKRAKVVVANDKRALALEEQDTERFDRNVRKFAAGPSPELQSLLAKLQQTSKK
mmetsp:Transcript_53611/g.117620  ORF Transcript_53611/g.117620 Transcript_53611/m.117620 type:complete len:124 (+) Transcript_53611:29-400(+)